MITVERIQDTDPLTFEVRVEESGSATRHRVTMARAVLERWGSSHYTPEQCVEAAFRFLLDREPKESILARFDVTVISRYFPDFEHELPNYLLRPP
jgi:hypothetical protein